MTFIKDPDAELDYTRTWADWLTTVSDTIETSTWIVPAGLEIGTGGDTHDDTTATIWLKGGTVGETYPVTNRIVTVGGRTDDRTFTITIRNR